MGWWLEDELVKRHCLYDLYNIIGLFQLGLSEFCKYQPAFDINDSATTTFHKTNGSGRVNGNNAQSKAARRPPASNTVSSTDGFQVRSSSLKGVAAASLALA